MSGLCERPGCSLPGAASYGMIAEELTFWIDHLDPAARAGVLCSKHADSMSVPRGWTLIDRREPDLHLFSLRTPRGAQPVQPPTRSQGASQATGHAKGHAMAGEVARRSAHATAGPITTGSDAFNDAIDDAGNEAGPTPDPQPTGDTRKPRGGKARGPAKSQFEQLPIIELLDNAPSSTSTAPAPSPGAVQSDGAAPVSDAGNDDGDGDGDSDGDSDSGLPLVDELTWGSSESAESVNAMSRGGGDDHDVPPDNPDGVTRPNDTDAPSADDGPDAAAPWMPSFDQTDDLDGMLDVTTPLLRRAFRGDRRG